jgi:hypothetical protein
MKKHLRRFDLIDFNIKMEFMLFEFYKRGCQDF